MTPLPFHSPENFEHIARHDTMAAGHWLVFRGNELLVEAGAPQTQPSDDLRVTTRLAWARVPRATAPACLGLTALRTLHLGQLAGTPVSAAEVQLESAPPPGMAWQGLRALFSVLDEAHFALAGRALQLIDWDRTHQFCGRCGTPTTAKVDEYVRLCPSCGLSSYPRISPAVMGLVRRGQQILLARGPHFPAGMYSALAGFVEPGESLEQALTREIAEEVGIAVRNVAYFASQPWPFPHSLMIAFTCEWERGEIRPQPGEIETAAWFEVFQLPKLPSKISIARRLIDAVAAQIGPRHKSGA